MPATFSHPIAVLPFRRFCPAPLNFAALVIGSMSPDFGYYFSEFPMATFAHTLPGTFLICLPTGILALAFFYLLRQPLCFVLPQPHRDALTPLASIRLPFRLPFFLGVVASLLIGAWTHTVWDSFTHRNTWPVEHIAFLREPLFHFGGTAFAGSYVLQQLSTFVGAVVLAIVYLRWLQQRPPATRSATDAFSDRHQYYLLAALVMIALAIAISFATGVAGHYSGYLAFRVFVFRAAVYFAAAFVPLLAVSSSVLYAIHREKSKSSKRGQS